MPLSRLRLRLAIRFALAFLAGLILLDAALYSYLRVQSDRRLTRQLRNAGEELAGLIRREYREHPRAGLQSAAKEALREWTGLAGGYLVLNPAGQPVAVRGPAAWVEAAGKTSDSLTDLSSGGEHSIRRVLVRTEGDPAFAVVVLQSTESLDEEHEALLLWLGLSLPLVLLLGLAGGYLLSRGALRPVERLQRAIAALPADRLTDRLPVDPVPDELDRLAQQFNALLDRLQQAQQRSRHFLRQAAHQIRTPLTLVMGEATLAPTAEDGADQPAAALRRIRIAAEQMQRRVAELFLLAEAQAGDQLELVDVVELDALVLECADVMRGRAHALGRRLELGRVAPLTIRGNGAALREAVLELVENACRHGTDEAPVQLEVMREHGTVALQVVSSGPAIAASALAGDALAPAAEGGIGVSIVRWIVAQHGGRLEYRRLAARNVFAILLAATGAGTGA